MNDPEPVANLDRLRLQIGMLESSCTMEEFVETCALSSHDAMISTTGFTAYTWWLEGGYGLHACFADGPGVITNRFGPCGLSRAGDFVWKLSEAADSWNTICGELVRDLAAGRHRASKTGG